MTTRGIHQAIQDEISKIEQMYDFHTLLAVEYGSRAWGLDDIRSDYDIRLIYRDPPSRAFSLFHDCEMMAHQTKIEGVDVDFSCWSLSKALKLSVVSNPQLGEFLNCPVRYREDETFIEDLQRISAAASPRVMAHYYRGSAKKNLLQRVCDSPIVDVKATLQMVRATLCAQWFVQNPEQGGFPPVSFEELVRSIDHSSDRLYFDETESQILNLIKVKREELPRPSPLQTSLIEQFGLEQMDQLPRQIADLPNPYVSQDLAERAFANQYPQLLPRTEVTCPEICNIF
jgi:predicted nucleotidyltransferase